MDVAEKNEIHLEMPPLHGEVIQTSTIEEDAHYICVNLDKAENMLVAVGIRLTEMLRIKYKGNMTALRRWYIGEIEKGKEHRKWRRVQPYIIKKDEKFQTREEIAEEVLRRQEVEKERLKKKNVKAGNAGAPANEQNQQVSGISSQKPVDHQLEDLVLCYFDLPRRQQDEFLRRINAMRIDE